MNRPQLRSALRPRRRRAFTLIELVVVIAVVGVLVALLLPAVQHARVRARRLGCASNLRQIGVALHAYHGTYRYFPPGGVEWRPWGSKRGERQLAWSAFLLPQLEQQPLYNALNLNTPFDSVQNATGASSVLAVYLCPASRRGTAVVDGRGACDYGGIFGERITGPNNPPKGTMLYDEPVSMAMIRDGASTTLVISEDSLWEDGQWINGRNLFDQAFGINAAPPYENDIRSEHPGGANGLLADGSVRFLSETMDLQTLAALCTRAGGEVVGEF